MHAGTPLDPFAPPPDVSGARVRQVPRHTGRRLRCGAMSVQRRATRPRAADQTRLVPMTPNVIRRQVVVEEHDLSADGRFAIVVRRFVAHNAYRSHLWYVPLTAGVGRLRQLTRGVVRDTRPRISPDGLCVAFRRQRGDGVDPDPRRLTVLDIAGLESWTVGPSGPTAAVNELAWSPTGDRLAFTDEAGPRRFAVGPVGRSPVSAPAGRGGTVETSAGAPAPRPAETPVARRITRIDWRWDAVGHVDRWEHLFVARVRGGAAARQLTSGDHGVGGIAWSPDGTEIAFVADRGPEPDLHPRTTIWAVPSTPAGRGSGVAEPREILALGGSASSPAWSPDGRWLAVIGHADTEPLDDVSPGLFVGPSRGGLAAGGLAASGSAAGAVALAPKLDRPIGAWLDTDLSGWMTDTRPGPFWADERTLLALVTDRGRSVPWRFPFDPDKGAPAGPPAHVVRAEAACWTLAVSRARDGRRATVAVVGTLDGRAMELMTVEDPEGGAGSAPSPKAAARAACLRTHTTIGSAWQRQFAQPEMRLVAAPGAAGPIELWLASPRDAADAVLPTIVDIHGGPLGAWAPAPSLEVDLLVEHGYRVILANIRGSASYGRDWIRPQLGDWGGVDAADVHAAVDHVIGLGLADPTRLGVIGLSYGGFMVNWLVGTSDRFAAAISENGVTNQINDWANSDSGPEYDRAALIGDPLSEEGMLRLWRQSPLAHVANVHTPLLMFQAEADLRCPAADNEQFFIALRTLGREVEYILYPDEYHTFAMTGRPDRRVDRMTRMLDWFDRHLGGR
jgi:dipeptidyl aminopeptidase/acylaminoacyl peptidase